MLFQLATIIILCLFSITLSAHEITDTVKTNPDTINITVKDTIPINKSQIIPGITDSTGLQQFRAQFDKILTINKQLYIVKVISIDKYNIDFVYPLNEKTESMARSQVSQIIYANGKREIFVLPDSIPDELNNSEIQVRKEKAWEQVEFTENKEDITNKYQFMQLIKATYEADRLNASTEFLEKNATIILRRRAASLGGDIILITEKEIARAYGELPGIHMSAEVYFINE